MHTKQKNRNKQTGRQNELLYCPDMISAALEVLRINPKFSVECWAKVRQHIDPANTARAAEYLLKAGLK